MLIDGYDSQYFQQGISTTIINEFFVAFNQNISLIKSILEYSKPIKDLLRIICKELYNQSRINTSILQAWFEIDFEKASAIFAGLKDSEIIVKKYGIMVCNNEKIERLANSL